jgi:hypothetical protein
MCVLYSVPVQKSIDVMKLVQIINKAINLTNANVYI